MNGTIETNLLETQKVRVFFFKKSILKFTRPSPNNTHICLNTKITKCLARLHLDLSHFHLIKYAAPLYIMKKPVTIYSLFNLSLFPQFHKWKNTPNDQFFKNSQKKIPFLWHHSYKASPLWRWFIRFSDKH